VKADESVTVSASFFLTEHIAMEVLTACPFTHRITLRSDGSEVASTRHMPPTLTLQYHFLPDARRQPIPGWAA